MPFAKLLPGADGPIKVIGRTHLGPKASLCLIEVAETTLLVSQTATGIQTLHVWPAGSTSASGERPSMKAPATPAATFPGQLKHLEGRLTGRNS
jgi:flagellar biogenesis protein FliO